MAPETQEIARGVHWLPLRGANVYLVCSEESSVLVDAGCPGSRQAIAGAARRLCGTGRRPDAILLTHGHPDHAGAAAGLAEAWGVPILVPALELPFVDGTSLYPEPLVAWLSRLLPSRAMDALTRRSSLGAAVAPFDPATGVPYLPGWTAVPTPGHTPGHVAVFRPGDRTLICGDAVLTLAWSSRLGGGGVDWLGDLVRGRPRLSGPPTVFTCDWLDAAASVAVLADLDPWVLASGHGRPLCGRHVTPELRAFAARVAAAGGG